MKLYIAKHLVKYNDTVLSFLHHLLSVNGNGIDYDPERGFSLDGEFFNEVPDMTEYQKYKFEESTKEARFKKEIEDIESNKKVLQACHAGTLASYFQRIADTKWVDLTDEDFSVDALYQSMVKNGQRSTHFYRPYPWCRFARILKVQKGDDPFLEMVCKNYCKAWIKFLRRELLQGNYMKDKSHPYFHSDSKAVTKDHIKRFKKVLASLK